jgi:hypothetical protein
MSHSSIRIKGIYIETDIITSIASSLIGQALILVAIRLSLVSELVLSDIDYH